MIVSNSAGGLAVVSCAYAISLFLTILQLMMLPKAWFETSVATLKVIVNQGKLRFVAVSLVFRILNGSLQILNNLPCPGIQLKPKNSYKEAN